MNRSTNATIDLQLVSRFVRVAEARSFAAAAKRTGQPKSTLSRSVTRLEEALGVRLIERTTRALRLTDEGRRLFESASVGLGTLEEALDLASESPTSLRGTLRISAPPDLGDLLVVDLIAAFVAVHPDVRVEVTLTNRYVDLVKEGYDLALRAGTLEDSSLVARKLLATTFGVFASPNYLAKRGMPRHPKDLASHEAVLFRPIHGEQRITLKGPRAQQRVALHGRLASDDLSFVRSACVRGIGVAVLPEVGVALALRDGHLVRVLPGYTISSGALHLVYPSSRLAPARLVAFRDFAVAHFKAACATKRATS